MAVSDACGATVFRLAPVASFEVKLFENEDDVMSVKKVASILNVSEMTIRREINRGRLDCFHAGRSIRVTKEALLRYVGEGE